MVVVSTAASDAVVGSGPGPIRTCIGCRTKTVATELFRVVVARVPAAADSKPVEGVGAVLVVPDPGRSAAGRGAWLHPRLDCAQQAHRRRAFARALRVPGLVDPRPVLMHFEQQFG